MRRYLLIILSATLVGCAYTTNKDIDEKNLADLQLELEKKHSDIINAVRLNCHSQNSTGDDECINELYQFSIMKPKNLSQGVFSINGIERGPTIFDWDNTFNTRIYMTLNETNCLHLGVNNPTVSEQSKDSSLTWGRVDFFDDLGPGDPGGYDEQPTCRPPGGEGNPAAYALCAEKDGKQVLICISQQTDDPALAEQIFSTFKWLK